MESSMRAMLPGVVCGVSAGDGGSVRRESRCGAKTLVDSDVASKRRATTGWNPFKICASAVSRGLLWMLADLRFFPLVAATTGLIAVHRDSQAQ